MVRAGGRGEFTANVKQEELDESLFDTKAGLFEKYPEGSGLLFLEEGSKGYKFVFTPNPFAGRNINIPSGWFEKHLKVD